MKTLKLGLLIFTLFTFSCGPRVVTTKTTDADLSNYKTFAYLPNSNFEQDIELGYSDETVGQRVIENVNMKMKEQGYTIDRDNPDLLILLSTKSDTDTTVSTEPVYATYPNYYAPTYTVSPYYNRYYYSGYNNFTTAIGYERNLEAYKTGTLILSLVDAKSKIVVWRGSATDVVNRENTSMAIAKYVDDIFEEFPKK